MSIKLYDGYIMPALTMHEQQNFINLLRSKLELVKNQLIIKSISDLIYKNFDDLAFQIITDDNFFHRFKEKSRERDGEYSKVYKDSIFDYSLLSLSKNKIVDSYKEIHKSKERNPDFDYQFSVCFIGSKNKTYAVVYTEKSEYIYVWRAMKGVKSYPYWNNTDPEDGVSRKDWKKRGKEWEKILKGFQGPGLIGSTVSLINDWYLSIPDVTPQDIIERIPSLDIRANRLSLRKTEKEVMATLKEKTPEKYNNDSFDCYFDARDFINDSEEGKALLEKNKQEILTLMVEITPEILEMNYTTLKEKYGTRIN